MPFGLTRKTWPLEVRLPKMAEASGPSTRLRATDSRPGWTKTTLLSRPMEKVCQLMATRGVVWLTVRVAPPDWMVAPPAVTAPPVGKVWAWAANASGKDAARPKRARREGRPAEVGRGYAVMVASLSGRLGSGDGGRELVRAGIRTA